MNKALQSKALAVTVAGQIAILLGIYILAALPLWTGEELRMKTVPVDPRSLFRGNYALLQYEINMIDNHYFDSPESLRNGEVVYVTLKQGPGEMFTLDSASTVKPTTGIFLRGRIEGPGWGFPATFYRVNYGIEAYFAPKEEALSLERELRDGGVAVLMVSAGGKARLKSVEGG